MKNDPNLARLKNFEESKLDPFTSKFGLFSFAGTLAIQPHSYESCKSPRREKDGTVKTSPKNISASPRKTGKTPDAYFSMPGFISIGDSYRDPRPNVDKAAALKVKAVHDAPFKVSGPFELRSNFEHLTELSAKKGHKRTQSTEPRGFYTSPMKKGSANCTPGLTFAQFEHQSSKPLVKLNKISRDCEKFKPSSNSSELFDRNIYAFDGSFRNKVQKKNKKIIEVPFKPSSPAKRTLPEALFGIHEYVPLRANTPKIRAKKTESPVPWKATTKEFTIPTVPTAMMPLNLRKEFRVF